jgi:hypothetical protein
MPREIAELLNKPDLLIAILLVGAFVGMAVERLRSEIRRRAWRDRNRGRWERTLSACVLESSPSTPKPDLAKPKQPDAADQMRIVMGADFTVQPLLNKSEARVFRDSTAS